MSFLSASPLVERLGWVLVHSLWQFVIVAIAAAVVLRIMVNRTAAARYGMLLTALALLMLLPAATWFSAAAWPVSRPAAGIDQMPFESSRASDDAIRQALSFERLPPATSTPLPPSDVILARRSASGPSGSGEQVSERERAVSIDPSWWSSLQLLLASWLPEIVAGWCLGVSIFACRPLIGWFTIRRLRTLGTSPIPPQVRGLAERAATRLQLHRAVDVLQSSLVRAPMVAGYLRPVVLLPLGMITGMPASQLEAILTHEFAHIRRHDYLVNALQTILETVFFYHPAVWWISRRIRDERENCCDDLAVASLGDRSTYGRALLAVEELRGQAPVLALGAHDGSLLKRIRRLVSPPAAPRSATALTLLPTIVVVAIAMSWFLAPGASAENQRPPDQLAADGDSSTAEEPRPEQPTPPEPTPEEPKVDPEPSADDVRGDAAATDVEQPAAMDPVVFDCDVRDRKTGGRIRNAKVTWRIEAFNKDEAARKTLFEEAFQSDESGRYQVRIPRSVIDELEANAVRTVVGPDWKFRGLVWIEASHPDYLPISGTGYPFFLPGEGAAVELDHRHLLLKPGVEVTGRFLLPDGSPAANLAVMVARNRKGFGDSTGDGHYTRTGADGRFLLVTRYDWPQRLHWFPENHVNDSRALTKTFGDQGTIRLKTGPRIQGRIESHDGKPLEGIVIQASTGTRVPLLYATSDANGQFAFAPSPPGEYHLLPVKYFADLNGKNQIAPTPPPFDAVKFNLSDVSQPVVLRAPETITVRFRLVDKDGNPVTGRRTFGSRSKSVFTPVGDQPGLYEVQVAKGDAFHSFVLWPEAGETVQFRSLPSERSTITSASESQGPYYGGHQIHLNLEGRDELEAVIEVRGSGAVMVGSANPHFRSATAGPVGDGQTPVATNVARQSNRGQLQLTFEIPGGPPHADIVVSPLAPGGKQQSVKVRNGGTLAIRDLLPGLYQVYRHREMSFGGYSCRYWLDMAPIEVDANQLSEYRLERENGRRISGQILEFEEKTASYPPPVANSGESDAVLGCVIVLDANAADESRAKRFDVAACDKDGKFLSEPLEPGKYRLRAELHRPRTKEESQTATNREPDWIGETIVTIPPDRDPEPVDILLGTFQSLQSE